MEVVSSEAGLWAGASVGSTGGQWVHVCVCVLQGGNGKALVSLSQELLDPSVT